MSARPFQVGDRVQAVLADEGRTQLSGMVGTVIPKSDWPIGFPMQWTEDNTLVVRWDRGSCGTYNPQTANLVLIPADDGTEAEAIAEVQIPHPGGGAR